MKNKINIKFDQRLSDLGFGIENKEKNELILHPLEYAYAVKKGFLNENSEKVDEIISEKRFEYSVFSYLREKGYITRTGPLDYYRIYRKGFRRNQDRTMYLMRIIREKKELDFELIEKDIVISMKMRKDLIYCINDNEKITFYSITKKVFS